MVEVRGWDFHHGQSQEKVRALKMVWRAPAKDLGDGRYVAHLPHLLFETGLAVGVSVSLWWTRADVRTMIQIRLERIDRPIRAAIRHTAERCAAEQWDESRVESPRVER